MTINLLEFAQKLAQGGRAKVVEDRQRLEKMQAQWQADSVKAKCQLPDGEPFSLHVHCRR